MNDRIILFFFAMNVPLHFVQLLRFYCFATPSNQLIFTPCDGFVELLEMQHISLAP